MAESSVIIVNSTAEWKDILAEAGNSGKAVRGRGLRVVLWVRDGRFR